MDTGFILALPFHHRDLKPDCVGVSTRGLTREIKYTSATLCAKNAGGGGVFAGH